MSEALHFRVLMDDLFPFFFPFPFPLGRTDGPTLTYLLTYLLTYFAVCTFSSSRLPSIHLIYLISWPDLT